MDSIRLVIDVPSPVTTIVVTDSELVYCNRLWKLDPMDRIALDSVVSLDTAEKAIAFNNDGTPGTTRGVRVFLKPDYVLKKRVAGFGRHWSVFREDDQTLSIGVGSFHVFEKGKLVESLLTLKEPKDMAFAQRAKELLQRALDERRARLAEAAK